MNMYATIEEAYYDGYAKGYEDGKRVINNIISCEKCMIGDPTNCYDGYVWCSKMGRYMKKSGFCSEGV